MKLNELLEKVQSSPEFNEWQKANPDAYLVHFFYINEPGSAWQIGYWDNQDRKMTSFILEENAIRVQPENEVLQKEPEAIRPLDLAKVNKEYSEILEICDKLRKEKYAKELPLKEIYVLQNLRQYGQVWNITIFSKTFKTLNIRIDAITGEVKHHDLAKLFEMEPGEGGKGAASSDETSYIG